MHRLKTVDPLKVLYKDVEHNYYTTLENARIEHPLENNLYICRGPLYQYYDTRAKEYSRLNPAGLRYFSLAHDDGVFYGDTSAPKMVNFIEGKPSRFDSPMFRHIDMPSMRGVNMKESDGNKSMRELTKPHEVRVGHLGISDRDKERKHDGEYTRRVRP